MKSHLTTLVTLLGLTVAVILGVVIGLNSMSSDEQTFTESIGRLVVESFRREHLEQTDRIVYERLTEKQEAIDDLIAGTQTFSATVARFEEIHIADEEILAVNYHGRTHTGMFAQNVLNWALNILGDRPETKATKARLKSDFEQYCHDHARSEL